jgi:hypothetical protein
MLDAFAGGKSAAFALPVLADFAAAFAQDFFFLENGFASLEEGVTGCGIGA